MPTVARETLRLTLELTCTNPQDPFAVAVIQYVCAVRHVPRTVSWTVSFFLGKGMRVGFHEVTGAMVKG